ncbi:MAG: TolC family protein, partial [Myxococcales bacterium]|nr:TolC family protein [Myxococcales bacterium]
NLIFPLYDRGERYADMDKHRQQLEVLEAELQKAEKDIRDAIRTHRIAVETADKSLESAARQTELARKTAEVIQRALTAGVITNLEVAEADTNVRLAEENEANLRWRRDLAMLQLRHAAGLLEVPR